MLLDIRNLNITLSTSSGLRKLVEHVNIQLRDGDVMGLVGESGSGKSLIAKVILGMSHDDWHVTADRFQLDGVNLLALSSKARRKLIGKTISIIYQNPQSRLDPSKRVGKQLRQMLFYQTFKGKWWQRIFWKKNRAIELLHRVGIKDHNKIMQRYPVQLTEGECQKVMIAMAIANKPKILIADEPTNIMDSPTEVQIFRLLSNLNQNNNVSILLLSHNIKMMVKWTNIISVIYYGQIVEIAASQTLISRPYHPYTEGLIRATPDFSRALVHKGQLYTLPGSISSLEHIPVGCRLGPRCPYADKICMQTPALHRIRDHAVACHFPLNNEEPIA